MKPLSYIIIATIVLLATACRHQTPQERQTGEFSHADSLLMKAQKSGSLNQMLDLVDHLQQSGELSDLRADYYRGYYHWQKGSTSKAEEYCRSIMAGDHAARDDRWSYVMAGSTLANICFDKRDFEGTIRIVLPLLQMMDSLNFGSLDRHIELHTLLGHCNLATNQPQLAHDNFEKAYDLMRQNMAADTTGTALHTAFATIGQIQNNYINLQKFADAEVWVAREDSLMPLYQDYSYPGAPFYSETLRGSAVLNRAMTLLGLGRKEEAKQAYSEFMENSFSSTDVGRINASDYLMFDHRYAEAADNYEVADRVIRSNDYELSLDLIKTLLMPKLRANIYAGRKETALTTARQIAEVFDSAYNRHLTDQTAELATIYDTQGKERQIAEQQAALSQQRLIGLAVALVLITLFFIIYTLYRRRVARRMAEMKAAQERIESELRIARDIQMSMLPSEFPHREGLDMYASMTPAKEVGGDLYGYVLNGDKLYFALGDVSGKGVPASLFMAQATRLFRTLATQGMMPAEICTRMNNALSGEDNKSSMFVTMFLGLVDLTTGHLNFCNAGHNPPVLGDDFIDMQPNAPIGIIPGLEFEGEELESIKDRTLFIYTDGLNEAENRLQEQFGDDRLLDILRQNHAASPRQLIEILTSEIEHHRDGAEPNDDLTMMCLRVG